MRTQGRPQSTNIEDRRRHKKLVNVGSYKQYGQSAPDKIMDKMVAAIQMEGYMGPSRYVTYTQPKRAASTKARKK